MAQIRECGKVRRSGGRSGDGMIYGDTSVTRDIHRRLDMQWQQIVTHQLGFKSLRDMRRQWHMELSQTSTPLHIASL